MERKVNIGNKWWKIMTIYSKEVKTIRTRVEDAMKENREECKLIGRGLQRENRRKRSKKWGRGKGDGKRKFKNKVENLEGKRLMELIEKKCMGSVEREQTRGRRRGETTIDYRVVNEEAWERVEEFGIGERPESDHLEIALKKRREVKEQRRKGVGDSNKTVYFNFFGIAVLCLEKM
jgi:hypothetical protein